METNINHPAYCVTGGMVLNLTTSHAAVSAMLHTRTDYIFTNLVIPLIMTVGILGNAAFIFAVSRVKSMQTIINAYLVNMAVADIIFVSSSVITLYGYHTSPVAQDTFFTSWVGCTLAWGLPNMLFFASLLSVTFVTVERYCAICSPLRHRAVAGKKHTARLLIITWIGGVLYGVCVTPDFGQLLSYCVLWPETEEYATFPSTIEYCVPFPSQVGNIFAQVVQITPFVLAMFGNLFMYYRILQELSTRPDANVGGGNASTDPAAAEDPNTAAKTKFQIIRNQVARLLITNGVIFFVCQAPFRLINLQVILLYTVGEGLFTASQFNILIPVGRTMIMVNACINVFVYLTTSSYYRKGFARAFGCSRVWNWSSLMDSKITTSGGGIVQGGSSVNAQSRL